MRITAAIRVVSVVYWLLLTVLLLAPDPLALFGITRVPGPPGGRMEHFLLFAVLAFLARASSLPLRWGLLAGLLVGYALLVESLQFFVPTRTVELLDYAENLLGLAAGWGLWGLVKARFAGPASTPEGNAGAAAHPRVDPSREGRGNAPD